MKRLASILWLTGFLACSPIGGVGVAQEPEQVNVALMMRSGFNEYYRPVGGKFTFAWQPMIFYVRVENLADAAVAVGEPIQSSISIELTHPSGKTVIVRRKTEPAGTNPSDTFSMLAAGESRYVEVQLDSGNWENVPKFEPGKRTVYKMRAIFGDNNGRRRYSKYNQLIVDVPGE